MSDQLDMFANELKRAVDAEIAPESSSTYQLRLAAERAYWRGAYAQGRAFQEKATGKTWAQLTAEWKALHG